jgi:hypothetical protein
VEEFFDKNKVARFEKDTGIYNLQTFLSQKLTSIIKPFSDR